MESDAPFTTAAKAPPRPLVRYFAAALLLALAVHLLLLVFLAVVVELGRPSPQAAILAFTQAEASGQTPKVSKTLSADEMALPPPPQVLDASVHGSLSLPVPQRTVSPVMKLGEAKPIFHGGGGMGLPLAMRSRSSMDSRMKMLLERGGLPGAEGAVQRALYWLVSVQNEDGSWQDVQGRDDRFRGAVLFGAWRHPGFSGIRSPGDARRSVPHRGLIKK